MKALEYKMAWGRPRYDVVQRKAQLKEDAKYRARIQGTKATLKIEAPREFSHMKHNPKKLQKLRDQKLKVAKENRTLLRNISEIMRTPAPCHAQPKLRGAAFDPRSTRTLLPQPGARRLGPRTIHLPGRLRRRAEIREENAAMRRRIDAQTPAVVTRATLARDFARAEEHLRTLSLLPRFPLLPETERAVVEARARARTQREAADARALARSRASRSSRAASAGGATAAAAAAPAASPASPAPARSPARSPLRTGGRRATHARDWRGLSRASRGSAPAELSLFESFVGEEMPSLTSRAGREAMARRLIEEHERARTAGADGAGGGGEGDGGGGGASGVWQSASGQDSPAAARARGSALRRAARAAESALEGSGEAVEKADGHGGGGGGGDSDQEGDTAAEDLAAQALERMLAAEGSTHVPGRDAIAPGGAGSTNRSERAERAVRWARSPRSDDLGATEASRGRLRAERARAGGRQSSRASVATRLSTGSIRARHTATHDGSARALARPGQ